MLDTKKRFFDIFEKVNRVILTESKLNEDKRIEIIDNFIEFLISDLNLTIIPKLNISYDPNEAKLNKSFANYMPSANKISVVINNRNLADVLRSIAHEMKHHQQYVNGMLTSVSGVTGSDEENDANAYAGIILRKYGKINPNIYE